MGVRLFFVLSGFLITGILLRGRSRAERGKELWVFYCRRFLRIFPVYYAAIALAAIVNIRPVRQTLAWHLCYLSNLYQVIDQPGNSPVTHFWSLAVEEQFYLLWPCLMLFLPRRHLLKAILATICAGPFWRLIALLLPIHSGEAVMFGCLDTLGMGALLAYVSDRDFSGVGSAQRFDRVALSVGLPAFTALLAMQAMHVASGAREVFADLALAFFFGAVVSRAAASFRGWLGALLEYGPVRYVGRISYGIYILHAFMPVVLFYGLKWSGLTLSATSPMRFILLVAMSIGAAAISWHFLEAPINAYKRHFEHPRPAVGAADAAGYVVRVPDTGSPREWDLQSTGTRRSSGLNLNVPRPERS